MSFPGISSLQKSPSDHTTHLIILSAIRRFNLILSRSRRIWKSRFQSIIHAAIGRTRVIEVRPGWRESSLLWTVVEEARLSPGAGPPCKARGVLMSTIIVSRWTWWSTPPRQQQYIHGRPNAHVTLDAEVVTPRTHAPTRSSWRRRNHPSKTETGDAIISGKARLRVLPKKTAHRKYDAGNDLRWNSRFFACMFKIPRANNFTVVYNNL